MLRFVTAFYNIKKVVQNFYLIKCAVENTFRYFKFLGVDTRFYFKIPSSKYETIT